MKPYIDPLLNINVNLSTPQVCALNMVCLTYSNIEMATDKNLMNHVEYVNDIVNKEDRLDFKKFKDYLINAYSQSLIDNTRNLVWYINKFQSN